MAAGNFEVTKAVDPSGVVVFSMTGSLGVEVVNQWESALQEAVKPFLTASCAQSPPRLARLASVAAS